MKKAIVKNNIVGKKATRLFQVATIEKIADNILTSAGPMGGITKIVKSIASPESPNNVQSVSHYTKDGKTILEGMIFADNGLLCDSVAKDCYEAVRYIKKLVGDGSTSGVYNAALILKGLIELEEQTNLPPREIIKRFKKAVKKVTDRIKSHTIEFTPQEAYDIAYISSNGNEEVAENIRQIYEEFGKNVYIDVKTTTAETSRMKIIDGMSINTGYSTPAFRTNLETSQAILHNPRIYYFTSGFETPELQEYLAAIMEKNIFKCYREGKAKDAIPTVIIAPRIASDYDAQMKNIINICQQYDAPNTINIKPPVLFITNVYQDDVLDDLLRLCDCKKIRTYINPENQKQDQEKGIAPTIDNIETFYGTAEQVIADATSSRFINPKLKFSTVGEEREKDCKIKGIPYEYQDGDDEIVESSYYITLISALEAQYNKALNDNAGISELGDLERRINSLKSKVVEYQVGGISILDRDSLMDSVKDAVYNCMSAAKDGVGLACNMEGYFASKELLEENKDDKYIALIYNAFKTYICKLYSMSFGITDSKAESLLDVNSRTDIIDIAEGLVDDNKVQTSSRIKSSIMSDVVVLDAISNIITLSMNTVQIAIQSPLLDAYTMFAEEDEEK